MDYLNSKRKRSNIITIGVIYYINRKMRLSVFQSPLFETFFFFCKSDLFCSLCYLIHIYHRFTLSSCANHRIWSVLKIYKKHKFFLDNYVIKWAKKTSQKEKKNVLFRSITRFWALKKPCYLENRVVREPCKWRSACTHFVTCVYHHLLGPTSL